MSTASSRETRCVGRLQLAWDYWSSFFFFCKMVTLESCHKLLPEDVIPELENWRHLKKAIFEQDHVKPPHTADVIVMLLRKTYKKDAISNHFPHLFNCGWLRLPYCPDLNPCDYILWGLPQGQSLSK